MTVHRAPVRWGILGTGLIGREHVIPAIKRADRCELLALASRSIERARDVCADFAVPRAYGSYEELLADPDIDAVYLPLPNHLHAPWIARAADAGKHVLCEKPLTLTADEAAAAAAYCRDRDVLLMEAFMYRFHPAWTEARRLVAAGAIGTITDVEVWFAFRGVRSGDYRLNPAFGGGALLDVGCYAVNLSRWFLGDDPRSVQATARRHPSTGVDMTLSAILDYDIATAAFTCSMEMEPDHRIRLHGTDGWLSIEDPFNCPADVQTTITVATGGDDHPHDSSIAQISVAAADQYALQATAFATAVLQGGPVPLPPADSVANLRLLERLAAAVASPPPTRGAAT